MQLDQNTEAEKEHDRKTKWVDGITLQQQRDELREEIIYGLKWDEEIIEEAVEDSGFFIPARTLKQIQILLSRPIPLTDRTADQIAISNLQQAILLDFSNWIEMQIEKDM